MEGYPAEEEGVVEFLGGRRRCSELSRGRKEKPAIRFRLLPALFDPVEESQRSPWQEGSRLGATEKNPSMEDTTTSFKIGNIRAMEGGKV